MVPDSTRRNTRIRFVGYGKLWIFLKVIIVGFDISTVMNPVGLGDGHHSGHHVGKSRRESRAICFVQNGLPFQADDIVLSCPTFIELRAKGFHTFLNLLKFGFSLLKIFPKLQLKSFSDQFGCLFAERLHWFGLEFSDGHSHCVQCFDVFLGKQLALSLLSTRQQPVVRLIQGASTAENKEGTEIRPQLSRNLVAQVDRFQTVQVRGCCAIAVQMRGFVDSYSRPQSGSSSRPFCTACRPSGGTNIANAPQHTDDGQQVLHYFHLSFPLGEIVRNYFKL